MNATKAFSYCAIKVPALLATIMLLGIPPCFAADEPDFQLRAEQSGLIETKSNRGSTHKITKGVGWVAGRLRRVLVNKTADEGAWTLWKLQAMDTILRAYNERNEQFGRPVGCTKFRIHVQRSGIKTAKFEAEILKQHDDPKVAECFLKALQAMEDKDLHYPSLMYGSTYRFVFDVCANGQPLSVGGGCL